MVESVVPCYLFAMQIQKLLAGSAIVLASALPLATFAGPIVPPPPGSTLEQVRAAVEQYFEAHPGLRPTDAWRKNNPPSTCSKPTYPLAGMRDELAGTAELSFNIGADGKAINVRLRRSSGWAVLDEVAFEALAACTLVPGTTETQTVSYRFHLE
jgi:TonB family protein